MSIASPFSSTSNALFGDDRFPNPFMDVASLSMPDNNRSALDWCEFIWNHMGTYRAAVRRVNSYFLTEVDISSFDPMDPISDDEKEKYKTFFEEQLDVMLFVLWMLDDRSCYGNAFGSVIVPFRRMLMCRNNHCGTQFPLREVVENKSAFNFDFSNYDFKATCPKCGHRGIWDVEDRPDKDEGRLKLKRWNPKEIEILHDFYSDECQYIWRIPEEYKKELATGNLYALERAPKEVLKAVKNNWVFRFAPDSIFHMREPVLAGQRTRGWGISRTILNYRQIYYVQVLRRYNEAIALDYVIPFRLITPDMRQGSGQGGIVDPMLTTDMSDFMGQTRAMLKRRRHDPAGWHTMPYPVKYQVLGGDAQALAPRDLLDQGIETLLNETGVPVEMYKGSLTLQTAPVAMRLFEANWHHLVHDMNMFLGWLVRQISQVLSWESVKASMTPVNYVDDMNRQMALLQLMMGQTISSTTGLRNLGIDWKAEQRQLAEEARFSAEQQSEVQEEMEQSAFGQQMAKGAPPGGAPAGPGGAPAQGGAPAPGGDPAAGGAPPGPVTGLLQSMSPNTPVTPQDMLAEAESLSQQLLGLPSGQRDSELRALKQKNEVLHSLVKAKMTNIRSQARSAGQSMILSQQFGQA